MTPLDFAIAGLYVAGVLFLGLVVSRSIHSFRDYFVAGGRMTAPLLVCTLVSTYYGLDVLLGASEVGYMDGVVGWFWYSRPYYLALLITAIFLAGKLRGGSFMSLPDVAALYGPGTRAVVAVASFFYSLPLFALMGMGILLEIILGIPFSLGVILAALVSVAYTLMGGLLADALTDTVQFTLMCLTLGIAAALALGGLGGAEGLLEAGLPATHFQPRGSYPGAVLVVFSTAALSVFVEPALYQRIFAAESRKALVMAMAMGVVLWAAYDWITTVLGMAARAAGVTSDPSYALLTLVIEKLPAGLMGLFVAGVIATGMSTVDSYLLIAGGNLAYDLYRPMRGKPLSDRDLLRLTRWGIVAASLVSVALALFFRSVVSAWVFMAAVLVATAFVPVGMALLRKDGLRPAAGIASSVTGLSVVAAVYLLVNILGEPDDTWGTVIWTVGWGETSWAIWQEYAVLAALPASALAFWLGQRWGRPTADRPPAPLSRPQPPKAEGG